MIQKIKTVSLYHKYHLDKEHTSIGLFRKLEEVFNIDRVLYPGSHVHITPSLVFPNVVYADSFRNTYKFFEDVETKKYINQNKEYAEGSSFYFFQQDYNKPFAGLNDDFDLIISQYAGFVGQATKRYLKKRGLLVCNNSYGDASMASIDTDYKLVGVYRKKSDIHCSISFDNLEMELLPLFGQKLRPILKLNRLELWQEKNDNLAESLN